MGVLRVRVHAVRPRKATASAFRFRGVPARIPSLLRTFKEEQFVEIEDFVPADLFELAKHEIITMFQQRGHRRELHIESTGNTPRYYSNLDRNILAEHSTVIPAVFRCTTLLGRLSEIAGQDVLPVPYQPEEF